MIHRLDTDYLREHVKVHVIGCGGTGSHMIGALARMHVSLRALGHPFGFNVAAWDPDEVTAANAGRQLFSPSDIGLKKATLLVERVNRYYGLAWDGYGEAFNRQTLQRPSIVVGCVDNNKTRKRIHDLVLNTSCYWLDCGNESTWGQVVLGNGDPDNRLPLPSQLFPKILKKSTSPNTPSCSLAGALARQDLFVNSMAATLAGNLLWRLFRHGSIEHHGYFFNLATGQMTALPVDEQHWARLGWTYDENKAKGRPSGARR